MKSTTVKSLDTLNISLRHYGGEAVKKMRGLWSWCVVCLNINCNREAKRAGSGGIGELRRIMREGG